MVDVAIVDRGRGPQLSNSRITVQDVLPYLQRHLPYERILEAMPSLTYTDISVIEQYVRDHRDEVMEQDRLIRERSSRRQPSPEVKAIAERGRSKLRELRLKFDRRRGLEGNGDHAAG
jgi:uncharacterized protein (DUF433 family)